MTFPCHSLFHFGTLLLIITKDSLLVASKDSNELDDVRSQTRHRGLSGSLRASTERSDLIERYYPWSTIGIVSLKS